MLTLLYGGIDFTSTFIHVIRDLVCNNNNSFCLKNNQHDVTCGLSFIFMGSCHSLYMFRAFGKLIIRRSFSLYSQPLV